MREIKFRGKAINRYPHREYRTNYKNGDWVYGLIEKLPFYKENGEKFFERDCAHMRNTNGISDIDVDENTLGQYTGLKDKNGKEIYEGDIVLVSNQAKAIIMYDDKKAVFVLNYGQDEIPIHSEIYSSLEVIGNVFDNPELVEKEEEK